jgi:hypothetical protein
VLEKLDGAFPVWKDAFAELQKCVNGENYYKYVNTLYETHFSSYGDSKMLLGREQIYRTLEESNPTDRLYLSFLQIFGFK